MNLKFFLAGAAVLALSSQAHAGITVDGYYDAAYGAAKSTVAYDPGAPDSNFGSPTNASKYIGYSIFLAEDAGSVYGYLRADGPLASVGPFANVYWDLDPGNSNGSDLGFELSSGAQNVFIPGRSPTLAIGGITVATSADQLGVEFAIPDAYFEAALPGLSYYAGRDLALPGGKITLRLSQSFGYSVAGGATYGDDRLGAVTLSGAVPEPATWAMMLMGFAGLGLALRSRRAGLLAA